MCADCKPNVSAPIPVRAVPVIPPEVIASKEWGKILEALRLGVSSAKCVHIIAKADPSTKDDPEGFSRKDIQACRDRVKTAKEALAIAERMGKEAGK